MEIIYNLSVRFFIFLLLCFLSLFPPLRLSLSLSVEHHSGAWDSQHLVCSSGSRGSVHICLHHQRPQVQSPLLPCLHCFWCGQYWHSAVLTGEHQTHCPRSHSPIWFLPFCQNLAYEIILTLGQAFEVAYQLALQARKSGHGSSTLPESFDSKPSKPVPKPRINIRKSVSNAAAQLHYCSKTKSIPVKFHNSEATCSRWSGLDCFGLKWKNFKFFEFHSNKALLFSLDSVHNTLPVSSSLIYIISKHLRLVF